MFSLMGMILSGVVAFAVVPTSAADLTLPYSLNGTVSHIFNRPVPGRTGSISDSFGVTAHQFAADLSTLSRMTLNLSVKAGDRINVALPAGKTGTIGFSALAAVYGLGDSGNGTPPEAFQFFGLSGPAPILYLSQTNYYPAGGAAVSIDVTYTFNAPFSFTGWSDTLTGPLGPSNGQHTFDAVSASFTIGYPSSVDGGQFTTIVPESLATWLNAMGFASGIDLSTPLPDLGGTSLLMAYALNLDPNRSYRTSPLPKAGVVGNQLSYTFSAGMQDVSYLVEASADLVHWSGSGVTVTAPDANAYSTASVPLSGGARFLRLAVSH